MCETIVIYFVEIINICKLRKVLTFFNIGDNSMIFDRLYRILE